MFWLKLIVLFLLSLLLQFKLLFAYIHIDTTSEVFHSKELNFSFFDSDSIKIDEIRILGNKKTKSETILRELHFDQNKIVTKNDLKFFENRILSLGIFNDVKVFVSREFDKNIMIILVQESWYIWPLPFIDIADRDWKKITYGLNVGIQNLTGKNESLNTGFSLGYDPKFYLSYFNPNFSFEDKLIFMFKTSIQKRKNKSLKSISLDDKNYNEKYFNIEIGIGKRINLFNLILTSFAYEYLQVEKYLPLRTVSENGIDKFFSILINYTFDSRDFSAYLKSGTNLNLAYKKVGLGESVVNYHIFAIETKKIVQLGYPILYFRNYSRFLSGTKLPFYANSFVGYRDRLRGYFNDVFESNSMTFSNFELRFPLIEKYILQFDLPLIPEELITYNLSIDIHAFFDNALLFNNNQSLKTTKAFNGFGFGFSFLFLPYRSINLEVAWNQHYNSQIIFDLNFPF